MTEDPEKRKAWPWWVWLVIILFPLPIGFVPWWVTVIFLVIFVVVVWMITDYLKERSPK